MGFADHLKISGLKEFNWEEDSLNKELRNNFEHQPITGIFESEAEKVWLLVFDKEDTVRVTHNHPFYNIDQKE